MNIRLCMMIECPPVSLGPAKQKGVSSRFLFLDGHTLLPLYPWWFAWSFFYAIT